MADTLQTAALITLAQNYAGDVVRQVNRTSMALRVLPIVTGEGKNVAWVASSTGAVTEVYAEGADAANFGSDSQAPATLNWAQYRSNFHVSGLARAAARTSMTPAGNVQLWARNIVDASAALAATINADVYNGDGSLSPKELTGLDQAIGSTTNTYASINRSTAGNEYWRPYLANPGVATAVTLAQLRGDISSIYQQCGEFPDIALCAPSVFDAIGALFDANRQYVQPVVNVNTARGSIKLDGGYAGLAIDGTVFLRDKDATLESGNASGRIYYLNTNYVRLVVLPQAEDPGLGPDMMLTANDGFGSVPLMFSYDILAKGGDSSKAQVKLYTELQVKKPHACGMRRFVQI